MTDYDPYKEIILVLNSWIDELGIEKDWDDDLHPADILDKHVFRQLESKIADEQDKVIAEVEGWAKAKRIVNTSGGFGHHMHNAVLAELRAKLVEMKGE